MEKRYTVHYGFSGKSGRSVDHAVGNPKPQTIASERYQKKAGYISKAFKLKREVAESFAEACEKAGVSQAGQITKMMKEFVEEVNQN